MKLQRYYTQGFKVSDDGDMCWAEDVAYLEARYEELEAKCAELEAKCAELLNASKLVVERWDSPLWRWEGHTGVLVTRLRKAIAKAEGEQP